jgi:superfamily I DNA and RNA helicase
MPVGLRRNAGTNAKLPTATRLQYALGRKPKQDILLPVCYRNPSWTLSLALALGLGVYREQGAVQMFDEPEIWKEIGFEHTGGDLALGRNVTLRRRDDRSPGFFKELLSPDWSVEAHRFDTEQQRADWIANSIANAIQQDELEPSDILVIIPEAITAASKAAVIIRALEKLSISSHLVGVTAIRLRRADRPRQGEFGHLLAQGPLARRFGQSASTRGDRAGDRR